MRQRVLDHPTRLVPLAFLAAMAVGTLLLMLPIARVEAGSAPFLVALFTATSAVCVTGLVVVDTQTYWSVFGQGVILFLIQIGGLGLMTLATLLGLVMSRSLRLTQRLRAQAETKSLNLGDVKSVLLTVIGVTLVCELVVGLILAARLWLGYGFDVGPALWHGLFHAISAFNNAGFSTWSTGLIGYQSDGLFLIPIMVAVVLGGIGFPVFNELRKEWREPRGWSVHAKITVYGSLALLILGWVAFAITEWTNPKTFGPMAWDVKLLNAAAHSVWIRTAGFNAVDIGQMRSETLLLSDLFMLIGGGSAGTAGGIKVTTFFLLGFVVWAELRGQSDVTVSRRRICPTVVRQALAVVLLAVGVIGLATLALLAMTSFSLDKVLFEAVSAFATVGLSTGITAALPPAGQAILIALMFIGRVGTITVGAALALRHHHAPFRYPEERPIVG
jgi:trk system potassium uptake protein TrkH